VLHRDDPILDLMANSDYGVADAFRATNGQTPRLFLWEENPTAESFARWAAAEIQALLTDSIIVKRVRVWETATSYADWDYGLLGGS